MRTFLAVPFVALLLASPALADDASYVSREQVDITHLLPPPPQPGSAAQQRDIATVLIMQATASPAERERALKDAEFAVYRVGDVLGPKFRKDRLPVTDAFLKRAFENYASVTAPGKAYFHHDRPFVMDSNVRSEDDVVKGVCAGSPNSGSPPVLLCPNGVSYSYPSGHSTLGTFTALVLAEMIPERRDELLLRGRQYGESRVIVGAHFPTDIEAGRIQGTVMFVLMMQNEHFRSDLAEARAELRKQLGLPPAP